MPVTLAGLLQPGGMIMCDDKWFTNFFYETVGPDMPSADQVLVRCITAVAMLVGLGLIGGLFALRLRRK